MYREIRELFFTVFDIIIAIIIIIILIQEAKVKYCSNFLTQLTNLKADMALQEDAQVQAEKLQNYCYSNPIHDSRTIEELTNKPKDCVISVQDTNIEVHRSVTSLVSSYFEASVRFEKLTDNNRESTDSNGLLVTIELDDMNEEAVRALVDYAYTGKINFTRENAQAILKCSDFFCCESVSESCVKFLSESLDYNEVIELVKISKKIHTENFSMYKVVTLFVMQNFSLFIQKKSFLDFDIDFLLEVLSHDKLVVMEELVCGDKTEFYFTTPARQEEIVLKCVIQYVQHVKDNSILPRLVKKCVRLGLISPVVRNKLQEDGPISSCTECLELFKIANEKLDFSDSGISNWLKPRDLKDVLAISWSPAVNIEPCVNGKGETYTYYGQMHSGGYIKMDERRETFEKPFDSFDDSVILTELCPVVFVNGVITYTHSSCTHGNIAGLGIMYSNGITVQHGPSYSRGAWSMRSGGDEFKLEEDERIVKVCLTSHGFGTYDPKSTYPYDYIRFQTNKGRGRCSDHAYEVPKPHPSACLAFIKGKTSYKLERKHLQFGWIYNKRMTTK